MLLKARRRKTNAGPRMGSRAISLCMLTPVLIVIAVAAMVAAFLAAGIWAVDQRWRRPPVEVTPARRPDNEPRG